MKISRHYFTLTAVLLAAYLLSACGGVLPQTEQTSERQAAIKVDAVEVAFTGVIEAMDGNAWTVNGQEITVDPAIIRDGPYVIGDTVKVEGTLNQDGVVQVTKVENPELANSEPSIDPVDTQSPDMIGTQEPVSTESPSLVETVSPVASNKTSMGDDAETFGIVEAINGDVWTINGQDYLVADFTEVKGVIGVGDNVRIHVVANADGTLTIREVEQSTGLSNDSGSSTDDASDDSYSSGSSSSNDSSSHDSVDDHDSSSSSNDSTSGSSSNDMEDDD